MNSEDDEFERIEREIKLRSVPDAIHHTLQMVFDAMSYGNAQDRESARLAVGAALAEQPVALESVYETIIHWDEGGGQRSRRELARRIVALYTTPPAQQDQSIDVAFFRQVLSVAIAGLYEHYKEDVIRAFTLDQLQTVVDLSESLGSRQVEDIYRRAWDMLEADYNTKENT